MIVQKIFNPEIKSDKIESKDYYKDRVGFWGRVSEVDSVNNVCSVRADTGELYKGLPIMSQEWVNVNSNDVVSGAINLPPIGSIVFVLMPTKTLSGAFVLCSGYNRGNKENQTLYSTPFEKDKNDNLRKRVTCGGWKITESYNTGNITIESKDNKTKISLVADDSEGTEKNGVNIESFNHFIKINEEGIYIENQSDMNISVNGCVDLAVNGNIGIYAEGDTDLTSVGKLNITAKDETTIKSDSKINLDIKDEIILKTESNITVNASNSDVVINADTFKVNNNLEVIK